MTPFRRVRRVFVNFRQIPNAYQKQYKPKHIQVGVLSTRLPSLEYLKEAFEQPDVRILRVVCFCNDLKRPITLASDPGTEIFFDIM